MTEINDQNTCTHRQVLNQILTRAKQQSVRLTYRGSTVEGHGLWDFSSGDVTGTIEGLVDDGKFIVYWGDYNVYR